MNKKLKIVFAGTPKFAVPTLEIISNASFEIICVLTQPDRKAGRGMKKIPSHVKNAANKLGLPIMQPQSLKSLEVFNAIKDLKADILVVAAYGLIIPEKILNLFHKGCLNVHASLLPRWRGAAPIQRSIMNLDNETGISIMKINEELDSGPVSNIYKIKLDQKLNAKEVSEKLSLLAADKILDCVDDILDGKSDFTEQDHFKISSNTNGQYSSSLES